MLEGDTPRVLLEQETDTITFTISDEYPQLPILDISWYFSPTGESDRINIPGDANIGMTALQFSDSFLSLTLESISRDVMGRFTIEVQTSFAVSSSYVNVIIRGMYVA